MRLRLSVATNLSKEFNQKMFDHTELKNKRRRKTAMSASEGASEREFAHMYQQCPKTQANEKP